MKLEASPEARHADNFDVSVAKHFLAQHPGLAHIRRDELLQTLMENFSWTLMPPPNPERF